MNSEAKAQARVGSVVDGRYQLTRLLGSGASGAVYDATHRYTDRRVALKLLHEELNESREHVGRFLREVRAMSALTHPGVAAILDAGRTEDDVPYLVTEFLEGSDMAELMDDGPLAHAEVVDIGVQLLDALAAAHALNIVHRDVKPDNVFLVPRGTRGDAVDHRSDLWSVGALLFHALSGEPPYDDPRTHRLLVRIATEAPPSLGALCPNVPIELVKIVDKALETDVEQRWQSAADMANALALCGYTSYH